MPNVVDSVKWIQDHAPNKMVTARTPQPGGWLYNKHSQQHKDSWLLPVLLIEAASNNRLTWLVTAES